MPLAPTRSRRSLFLDFFINKRYSAMNAFLLGILFFPAVWCYQHYVLYLTFHPVGELPALQMRLRHEDASFSIHMDREIRVYLDQRPIEWKALIEGAQGERTNVTLYPKRGKDEVRVTAVDKELVIVYHLGCEPNFYGPNCAKRCVPDEDDGRYTCDALGGKKCRESWRGKNCSEREVTTTTSTTALPPMTIQTSTASSTVAPPTTTSRPSTNTTAPTPIKEVIIESPNKMTREAQLDPLLVSVIVFAFVFVVLAVSILTYFLLCYKRRTFNKHHLVIPSPPKCDVGPVPKHSPPRYVHSPRRSNSVSFFLTPKLPKTVAPSHYMSQDDLKV